MNIRKANVSDAQFIIQSQIDMALESEDMVLRPEIISPGVNAVFQDPAEAKGHYLVAESEVGDLLGCLLLTTEWSDWRNGTILWIQSLYVIPSARGQKVFRQMYDYLQNQVQNPELNYVGIRLYVEKENQLGIDIYNKIGMSDKHYDMFEWIP